MPRIADVPVGHLVRCPDNDGLYLRCELARPLYGDNEDLLNQYIFILILVPDSKGGKAGEMLHQHPNNPVEDLGAFESAEKAFGRLTE